MMNTLLFQLLGSNSRGPGKPATWALIAMALFMNCLWAHGAPTDAPVPAPPATAPSTQASAQDDIDSLPVKAPDVGTITQRTTSGARSGPRLDLYLFAPGRAGATVKEHPTFYWYLAQQNDDDTEVVVAEVAPQRSVGRLSQRSVVMRKKYTGTQAPGIYAATLDKGALQPGKLYQVSVIVHLSSAGGAGDINSIGYVTCLSDFGADTDDPAACAKAGLWYDAIDAAMRRMVSDPSSTLSHHQLHALLHGERVFSSPGPVTPIASPAVRQEEEKAIFTQLEALHDVLITTKPPDNGREG